MKIIESATNNKINCYTLSDIPDDKILFFDIETTGFTPAASSLYMIGLGFFSNNKWYIRQYLSTCDSDEADMVKLFLEFIKDYDVLVHFNGDMFDIPYIAKKSAMLNADSSALNLIKSFDVYRYISPFRKLFPTANLKQKSMENFLGLHRTDKMDGGALIPVFKSYMKNKDANCEKLLLRHNHDDVEGLMSVLSITNYIDFFRKKYTSCECTCTDNNIIFKLTFEFCVPVEFSFCVENVFFKMQKNMLHISLSKLYEEMKYFFSDYKNYYYLKLEDEAIHKSVSSYVDKAYRLPATAATCYVRKKGCFLPAFSGKFKYLFKRDYYDKTSYVLIPDNVEYDMDFIKNYVEILRKIPFKK